MSCHVIQFRYDTSRSSARPYGVCTTSPTSASALGRRNARQEERAPAARAPPPPPDATPAPSSSRQTCVPSARTASTVASPYLQRDGSASHTSGSSGAVTPRGGRNRQPEHRRLAAYARGRGRVAHRVRRAVARRVVRAQHLAAARGGHTYRFLHAGGPLGDGHGSYAGQATKPQKKIRHERLPRTVPAPCARSYESTAALTARANWKEQRI